MILVNVIKEINARDPRIHRIDSLDLQSVGEWTVEDTFALKYPKTEFEYCYPNRTGVGLHLAHMER